MKIKLLLVSPLPKKNSFGGIGSWTIRFVKHLQKNENIDFEVIDNIPVDKKGRDIARTKNIFKKIAFNYRVYKSLKKKISSLKPNVVHFNSSCTPLACLRDYVFLKYCFNNKIKTILHCRCNVEYQIGKSKIGNYFFKKNVNLASSVITLNSFSFDFVCKKKKTSAKVFIIPNFIEKTSIIETKEIKPSVTNIVFVGHILKQKGIGEIINLAEKFSNIHFTLVGGFTEEYSNSGFFPSNIEITGNIPVNLVIKKLDESDLFLSPTYSEGFSNALLEAMARGLPVVTTDVGANKDMVENKGGIIVAPNNINELCNALNDIQSIETRRKMSEWNIDKVYKKYTSDVVIKDILDIYFKLL